jgi:hypothetical protein
MTVPLATPNDVRITISFVAKTLSHPPYYRIIRKIWRMGRNTDRRRSCGEGRIFDGLQSPMAGRVSR